MVQSGWSNDGQSILTPTSSTVIPNLVHQIFGDPQLAQEHASVTVLNGSTNPGEASDVQTTLQNLGFNAVSAGNADRSDYARSEVIVNTADSGSVEYSARRLARILDAALIHQAMPGQSAQIIAIVGQDFPAATSGQ
jgi:hypothetical protein